jgi:hypothetical protein
VNKQQNKIIRNSCLMLSPVFLFIGIVQDNFLYSFLISILLIIIFLYLRKSSINAYFENTDSSTNAVEVSDIKKSINARAENVVLGTALITLRQMAYDSSIGIGNYEEEEKDRLIFDCLVDIEKTLFEKDKIKAVRLKIMNLMLACAEMDVLLMKKPTLHELLSGELEGRIIELFAVSEPLQQLFTPVLSNPISIEDLKNEIKHRYLQNHFYLSAYNTVRVVLKDFIDDPRKDWYRPCYISFCIWQEDLYRSQLKMPLLNKNQGKIIALSGWASIAEEGSADLRETFETKWRNCFNEPSPFFDIAV